MNNQKRVRVLHFAPGFLFGGIESRLLDWYSHIDRDKVQFDLLKQSNNIDDTSNIARFRELGGEVYNIPRFSLKTLTEYIREIKRFFKENNDYDVVHSHSLSTGLFVLYYAKKYGIKKRILHARTSKTDGNFIKRCLNDLMKFSAPYFATHLFAVSGVAAVWGFGKKRVYNGQVSILKNGIQTDRFKYDQNLRNAKRQELGIADNYVVGNVCRLAKPKNLPFILSVFKKLIEIEPTAKLLLVGDGPLLNYVSQQIELFAMKESVILTGRQSDVWSYYMSMDILFSPSLFEGFPGTVLEAQATGLPCVISNLITDEVKMSDNLRYLDLSLSLDIWVNELLSFKGQERATNVIDIIRENGYDSSQVINRLQKYYTDES
ncbi:MAG: glycosyltransferase [Rikenellaceae bacterium]